MLTFLLAACSAPDPVGPIALTAADLEAGGPSADDYSRAVAAVHERAPDAEVFVVPPFVVTGDGEELQRQHEGLVTWARDHLREQHFPRDPDRPWTVWLLSDDQAYRETAVALFGREPTTPFGFARDETLVMNIATGGGTLVHEMVHPYVWANTSDPPPWIDEGLASLYEATIERDGRMVGLVNWRLEGLEDAIRREDVPSFRWLTSRTVDQFYDEDPGTNYGQSRYLMLWLQEHDRLDGFWRAWTASRDADPTGYGALADAVGGDLHEFQRHWEAWVLSLEP